MVTRGVRDIGQVFNIGLNAALPALPFGHGTRTHIDRVEIAMGDVVERLVGRAAKLVLLSRLSAKPPHTARPVCGHHAIGEFQPEITEQGFQLIFRELIREMPFDRRTADFGGGGKALPDREFEKQVIQVGCEADHDA